MKKKEYFFLVCLFALSFFICLQNGCSPIHTLYFSDGSIYQYVGHLICKGKMPYVDAFDHKGPILYLINALSLLGGVKGIWILDCVVMAVYSAAGFFIAKRFVHSFWAFWVSVLATTGLVNSYWIGNTPDWYSTVATLLCMYFFVNYFQKGTIQKNEILLIGVAVAFCFWQKFTTIVVIGCFCLGVLIVDYVKHRNNTAFRINCVFFCFLGFCLISIPLLAWLWSKGALAKMIDNYFLFSISYGTTMVSWDEKLTALLFFLRDPLIAISLVVTVLYAVLILALKYLGFFPREHSFWKDSEEDIQLITISCIALLLQALINAIAGRSYVQYKSILYPCALLEICIFLKFVLNFSYFGKAMKCVFPVFAAITLINNIGLSSVHQKIYPIPHTYAASVINAVRENTDDNSLITVASPDHCGLYLKTGKESATTYPYIQADLYRYEVFWKDYNNQLLKNKPAVIVWNNNWDKNRYLPIELLEDYETSPMGQLDILVKKG